MKEIIRKIITVSMILFLFCGCANEKQETDHKKIKVAVTIFPLCDWTRQLSLGSENIELLQIVSSSSDLHSYQPSAKDIMNITTADVFIYVGGESDKWVEDVLEQSDSKDLTAIDLMDALESRVLEEEEKEGMEEEHEEHEHEHEKEYDEHVWLSLKNAKSVCEAITKVLIEKDEANKKIYEENLSSYLKQLDELEGEFLKAREEAGKEVILFADRFPFLYLCKDLGIDYYAAFKGCSAETEASFETIRFLANKVDELGLKTLICLEDNNRKIAETIIENTKNKDAKIVHMHSMQSKTNDDDTYLKLMEENLEALKQALE